MCASLELLLRWLSAGGAPVAARAWPGLDGPAEQAVDRGFLHALRVGAPPGHEHGDRLIARRQLPRGAEHRPLTATRGQRLMIVIDAGQVAFAEVDRLRCERFVALGGAEIHQV